MKQKKKININNDKKPCKFILTTRLNNIIYGKFCNNICNNDDFCKNHINKKQLKFDTMADNLCQHIITQKSRNCDRKGMICGDFTFNSKNNNYCKIHSSRHNDNDNDNENLLLRTFKVRFFPNDQQKQKLKCFFGCARYTYNKCIENNENKTATELRDIYVTHNKDMKEYLKKTPKEIRYFAVKEYVTNKLNSHKNYIKMKEKEKWKKENFINYKIKNLKEPKITFRKKKDEQSITINKDFVKIKNKKVIIYPESFSKDSLILIKRSKKDKKLNKILDGILHHDIKIIKTETNKYYLCFTEDIVKNKEEQDKNKNPCAIDPGVRTFATVYSENSLLEIGNNMNETLGKLLKERKEKHKKYKAEIKQRKTKVNDLDYNKAKNEYKILNEKIKNIVNDLHYKAITKLTTYSSIYIPKLNSKSLMEQNTLNSNVKNLLQAEKHGTFVKRLIEKCNEKNVYIEIVSEKKSTKTCSNCFEENNPRESKIYLCKYCNVKVDRDINASKNIYMMVLAKKLSENIK